MILLSIVLVLLMEWYFRISPSYRHFHWFLRYRGFIHGQFPAQFDHLGGLFLILGLPALLLGLLLGLGDNRLADVVRVVVSGALLWYCLGPQDVRTVLAGYLAALERDDTQAAFDHARDILGTEGEDDVAQIGRSMTHFILSEINTRFIAVIFWFVVLGPAAALFYRLCTLYADMLKLESGHPHGPLLRKVRHALDWLPARFTALSYAFIGDFVRGYSALHPFWKESNAHSERILSESGLAALAINSPLPDDVLEENWQALALAERALLFFLVFIAVICVFGLLI